jgi:hypothetical protein
MKSGRKNARVATGAGSRSHLHDWTRARLMALTGAQLKALLLVASGPGLRSPVSASGDTAVIERLLADMSRAHGTPGSGLLERAASETTPVQELIRIKELAKALAREAEGRSHRTAARLLYHVAVAAAFVHHAATISGRPMGKQQELYGKFAASWAGHTIGRLFREAATRVADRSGPDAG